MLWSWGSWRDLLPRMAWRLLRVSFPERSRGDGILLCANARLFFFFGGFFFFFFWLREAHDYALVLFLVLARGVDA